MRGGGTGDMSETATCGDEMHQRLRGNKVGSTGGDPTADRIGEVGVTGSIQ